MYEYESYFMKTQAQMASFVKNKLKDYYSKEAITVTDKYILAEGTTPIALVAHLDTVWEDQPPKVVLFDPEKQVAWGINGLGADDRAGIIGIFKILDRGFRPHIIFTHDEEIGGLGAAELASSPCPFKSLRFIIELDRQGIDDCVFYQCANKKFWKYIESFGFKMAQGSFSDISYLCPSWRICGVNLSIGYYFEHTQREFLVTSIIDDTIDKVCNILNQFHIPDFKWEGSLALSCAAKDWVSPLSSKKKQKCCCCHKKTSLDNIIQVQKQNEIVLYCLDCAETHVGFCDRCGEPYETSEGMMAKGLCPDCLFEKELMEVENDEEFEF